MYVLRIPVSKSSGESLQRFRRHTPAPEFLRANSPPNLGNDNGELRLHVCNENNWRCRCAKESEPERSGMMVRTSRELLLVSRGAPQSFGANSPHTSEQAHCQALRNHTPLSVKLPSRRARAGSCDLERTVSPSSAEKAARRECADNRECPVNEADRSGLG